MDLDISKDSLAVFAALDSDVRIRIIQLLSKKTTKRFRDFKCPGAQQPYHVDAPKQAGKSSYYPDC